MSKTGYYGDYVIYAMVIAALFCAAALLDTPAAWVRWVVAFAFGLMAWTVLEYVLHRFAFHGLPIVSDMHGAHHDAPRALIGTPTWLSLSVIALGVFLPAWRLASLNVASGLAGGIMLGYLWYGTLHHAIHHGRPRLIATRARVAARRHFRHHGRGAHGNFGVTTRLWDALLGTELPRSP
ncbi:MAG TPA: sterol desaturase family protein [Steroidobacteraceae bacterium]|nr:sterol desaturase family protein [Steroidobacteraceae bacterium]